MLIMLTEQSVLLELSELLCLKTAGILRIDPGKVRVSWTLAGVAGVAGNVARLVGASSHIAGGMLPKVQIERCPELDGVPEEQIQQVVGVVVDQLRLHAAVRLGGIRQRRCEE